MKFLETKSSREVCLIIGFFSWGLLLPVAFPTDGSFATAFILTLIPAWFASDWVSRGK